MNDLLSINGEVSFPEDPPFLVVIVGPCRTGTTALSNNFVHAEVVSYMQPIKSIRRSFEVKEIVNHWTISSGKFASAKETLGPHTPAEFFDPGQILIELGYPKEKLIIIPIVRDPLQTFTSWKRMWGEVDFQKLVESFVLTLEIKVNAYKSGLQVIPYVHEVIKGNSPVKVVLSLFELLGIDAKADVINDWPGLRKGGEYIRFYDNPPEKFIDGIGNRGRYEYRELVVTQEDIDLVQSEPILRDIYEDFRESCEDALGFKVN